MRGHSGVRLKVTEAGPASGPLVLLVHGFPELAYSWRRQIPCLADAGYHVLAPDMRGYGGSSRPQRVDEYDILALTGDLIELADDVGAKRAALVGHDWGATVVWQTAQLHPDRVSSVVGLSVPPIPRSRVKPTEAFRRIFGDEYFYMLHYQRLGVADAELGADVAATMAWQFSGDVDPRQPAAAMLSRRRGKSVELPRWIACHEFDYYVREFSHTGFTGGLNWYRNIDRNWGIDRDGSCSTDRARSVRRRHRGSVHVIHDRYPGSRGGRRIL